MSWIETHGLIVLLGLALAASAVVILQQRRSPQSTLAWLMFLVLAPYLAVPVFLVMGFRKRPRPGNHADAALPLRHDANAPQVERMLLQYGLPAATDGNYFALLPGEVEAWEALLDVVRSASVSLDVTLYVLGNDAVGRAFCAALAERARDGVAVRVILDSIGSLRRPRAALRDLAAAGAEVHLYSPLLRITTGGHPNLRNHRKMVIADGARVWAGGRNVAEEYMGPEPQEGRWCDLSFRVDGPAAAGFADIFASDWIAARGKMPDPAPVRPPDTGRSIVQLVPGGPDVAEDPLHDALVYACHAAHARLWVVTPYFLPTTELSHALAIAARRGVDVRVVIPLKSNQWLADLARGAWLRDLAAAGCHVHLHPEMMHAKAVLADDLGFAGSANFDARSLLLNFEVMALLSCPHDIAPLRRWMSDLCAAAPEGLPDASFARRLIEGLFRLTSPIL
ncbi:MAG TPA: phospholipase D-like domain-containing protein [Roseovarius sp.]